METRSESTAILTLFVFPLVVRGLFVLNLNLVLHNLVLESRTAQASQLSQPGQSSIIYFLN